MLNVSIPFATSLLSIFPRYSKHLGQLQLKSTLGKHLETLKVAFTDLLASSGLQRTIWLMFFLLLFCDLTTRCSSPIISPLIDTRA
jgi:hypothetical protein